MPPQIENVQSLVEDHEEDEDEEETERDPLCDCEHMSDLPDTFGVTGIEDISLEDFPNYESTRLVPSDQMVLGNVFFQ